MNIIEQAREFVQSLRDLAHRTAWDWRVCPACGSKKTVKWGKYERHPWLLEGQQEVKVQRHRCQRCGKTYAEESPWLIRGSWYAREVHRCAIDHWLHGRTSIRRCAEMMRSWLGKQERYVYWRPLSCEPEAEAMCHLSASTVCRWLNSAGIVAERRVCGQLDGIVATEVLGADGLWTRLKGKAKRVVLMAVDSVSGVIWPPVVARGEESESPWQRLFERVRQAGLDLDRLRGVTSDGAPGLGAYLKHQLPWVHQQRCVWHMWRSLSGDIARAVSQVAHGVPDTAEADQVRREARQQLKVLIHQALDAATYEQAEQALLRLIELPWAEKIAKTLFEYLDRLLLHTLSYCQGIQRVSPECYWRDFRLRLSHGRNHRPERRLERACLVWAIYHNFTPTQPRFEHKRRYRNPGLAPLEVAGQSLEDISYLDALGV